MTRKGEAVSWGGTTQRRLQKFYAGPQLVKCYLFNLFLVGLIYPIAKGTGHSFLLKNIIFLPLYVLLCLIPSAHTSHSLSQQLSPRIWKNNRLIQDLNNLELLISESGWNLTFTHPLIHQTLVKIARPESMRAGATSDFVHHCVSSPCLAHSRYSVKISLNDPCYVYDLRAC